MEENLLKTFILVGFWNEQDFLFYAELGCCSSLKFRAIISYTHNHTDHAEIKFIQLNKKESENWLF